MSTSQLIEPSKMLNKPSNCRINSEDGLDVFAAEKYSSDVHATSQYNNGAHISQKIMLSERQPWKTQRNSLDMHNFRNSQTFVIEKPIKATTKENKYKQPSSPGGRLASFLNSLFNQTFSKKKKSSEDGDENPVVRRKRRSSISHVWTTRNNSNNVNISDMKSGIYQSSISGFRTPPPRYSYTTNKSHQKLHNYMNHQKVLTFNRVDEKKKGNSERKYNDWLSMGYSEKFNSSSNKFPEKSKNIWSDKNIPGEKKEFKNFNEDSYGYGSDSSSDLFELKNYDFNCCSSSGLPVDETTNMDCIKGAPVCR